MAKLYGTETVSAAAVNDQSDPAAIANSSTVTAKRASNNPATATDSTVTDTVVTKANLFLAASICGMVPTLAWPKVTDRS